MSLDLQPLIRKLGLRNDVSKDAHHNVSDAERLVSAFVGAAIVVSALGKNGIISKVSLLFTGGALLKRAMTGHCEVYDILHTDSAKTAQSLLQNFRRA